MDTWRTSYKGIVPDDYLEGLSYAESERLWQDVVTADDGCVFVAEDGRGVFGFASGQRRQRFSRDLPEYEGELKTVYVLPSGQGAGAGRRLVGAVARHLTEQRVNSMLLWAFTENLPARRFYESLGGVPIAKDGFELGGVWLSEVAYGWKDLDVLLTDGSGGRSAL